MRMPMSQELKRMLEMMSNCKGWESGMCIVVLYFALQTISKANV